MNNNDDVVESVNHNIAFQLDRVNNQYDLDLVILNFIRSVSMKRHRIFKENVQHEYMLMEKSEAIKLMHPLLQETIVLEQMLRSVSIKTPLANRLQK